jgi:hypothetical protein
MFAICSFDCGVLACFGPLAQLRTAVAYFGQAAFLSFSSWM